jgi:membrane protease YdiL (CAAX protease family)
MPRDDDVGNQGEEEELPLVVPVTDAEGSESAWAASDSPQPPPLDLVPVEVVPEELPPPRPPHPGFWWAVLWCLGILLVTQLLPGIVAVVILLASVPGLTPERLMDTKTLVKSPEYAQAMLWALLLDHILSVAMAWGAIRLIVGRSWPRRLALRWPSASHLMLALVALPALIVIGTGIDGLAKRVLPSFIDLEETVALFGKWPLALGVLVIGLGPGIAEELWFRGFFGRGLVARYGVVGGVLLTSLLFGLIHMEPRQVVTASVLGILLHLSYLATRSLLVPILLHFANNSLSILALHSPWFRAIDMPAEQIPWHVYALAVVLLAAVGWALFQSRKILVEDVGSGRPWWPDFPGVTYPPAGAATRVVQPATKPATWILVIASALAFAAAVAPVIG